MAAERGSYKEITPLYSDQFHLQQKVVVVACCARTYHLMRRFVEQLLLLIWHYGGQQLLVPKCKTQSVLGRLGYSKDDKWRKLFGVWSLEWEKQTMYPDFN